MTGRPNRMPVVFPMGREAFSWIRMGGTQARGTWPLRLMYRWQSLWFERNLALQRLLPPGEPLQTDPVFILGLWRTGTTYLHDLLGACPGMCSPTTSQCMYPA